METVNRILKNGLLFLLQAGYCAIKSLFPLPSGVCRHNPTCFHYAQIQVKERSVPIALFNITLRLLTCNPLFPRKQ